MDCYITGIGCVSAIGNNVEENLLALQSESCGIHENDSFEYKRNRLFLGNVKMSSQDLQQQLSLNADFRYSRTSLLGIMAAREAFNQHEYSPDLKTGFINGTSVGGMDLTESFYKAFKEGESSGYEVLLQHDCGSVTNSIADQIISFDYTTTISTACSSAANAILHGSKLIENNVLDRVVVGGTDALSVFTITGFDSLQILDSDLCKCFDQDRKGLNLGEGAAYLVLESEESLKQTKSKVLGVLRGGANQNDAFHQTATSEDAIGATLSMQNALKNSGLTAETIDYINVHGTGTNNNDLTESIALSKVFEQVPMFSSTKPFTGHTLAACGAIEAVYSILMLNHDFVPANLRFEKAIEATNLTPVRSIQSEVDVQNIMSNSFGFGGNDTTLIFSKYS